MTHRDMGLGLVGAGRWGKVFIRTLAGMEGVRLAALASRNPRSRSLVSPQCLVTPDWRELIAAGKVEGLIVATPPHTHAEIAQAAIRAGLPVLIEKPLALDSNEARATLDLAGRESVLVMVEHTHLFSPAYRSLKARLDRIGGAEAISSIRGRAGNWGPFRRHTPVLWDWGAHDVAMVLDLLGSRPVRVSARRTRLEKIEEGIGERIEIDLHFTGGRKASIELSNLMRRKRRFLAVDCATMTLIYDAVAGHRLVVHEPPAAAALAIPVCPTPPLTVALGEFVQAIAAGSQDLSGLRLAVDVVAVLERCARTLKDQGSSTPSVESR